MFSVSTQRDQWPETGSPRTGRQLEVFHKVFSNKIFANINQLNKRGQSGDSKLKLTSNDMTFLPYLLGCLNRVKKSVKSLKPGHKQKRNFLSSLNFRENYILRKNDIFHTETETNRYALAESQKSTGLKRILDMKAAFQGCGAK